MRVIATKSAEHFIRDLSFPQAVLPARLLAASSRSGLLALRLHGIPCAAPHSFATNSGASSCVVSRFLQVLKDEDEWSCWSKREDPVLHIDLRKWADVLLVAPLSANTLAKLANGLCDNLLTCVARAWDFSRPLLVAPAMNTLMWESPFTAKVCVPLMRVPSCRNLRETNVAHTFLCHNPSGFRLSLREQPPPLTSPLAAPERARGPRRPCGAARGEAPRLRGRWDGGDGGGPDTRRGCSGCVRGNPPEGAVGGCTCCCCAHCSTFVLNCSW